MLGDDEIKEMQEEIHAMEAEVAEKKKTLREARYAGLRTAMQARQEAEAAVRQELKDLGLKSLPTSFGIPLYSNWKF
jgi:hypothetical protein